MFEIFHSNNGGYFWRLKAMNGETLCHSEVFTTKQNAQKSIESVKIIAPNASVKDHTVVSSSASLFAR
jgi:uncharacterized protein